MPQLQTTGRKQRSTVDILIILNSTTENQKENKDKTYLFFTDVRKYFAKL